MNLRTSTYVALDEVARELWRLVETRGRSYAVTEVSCRYGMQASDVARDLDALLSSMMSAQASATSWSLRRISLPSWSRLRAISHRDWAELTKTLIAATIVEFGLRYLTLPRLSKALGLRLTFDTSEVENLEATATPRSQLSATQRQKAWAVDRLYACWPFPDTCLRRALVIGFRVRREQPLLRIGAPTEGEFIAHAWVETPSARFLALPQYASFHRSTLSVDRPVR